MFEKATDCMVLVLFTWFCMVLFTSYLVSLFKINLLKLNGKENQFSFFSCEILFCANVPFNIEINCRTIEVAPVEELTALRHDVLFVRVEFVRDSHIMVGPLYIIYFVISTRNCRYLKVE